MAHEIVGFMREQGYDDSEIREAIGPDMLSEISHIDEELGVTGTPMNRYDQGGAFDDAPAAVYDILSVARSERRPPGPQVVLAPGAAKTRPAKAVRVDTEKSYKGFRRAMKPRAPGAGDAPQNVPSLDALAEREKQILMGEDAGEFYRRDDGSEALWGDFYRRRDGAEALWGESILGASQVCVLCGGGSPGRAICGSCANYAVVGFGERGSAADIYTDDALEAGTAAQLELLGDIAALETPWPAYDEAHGVIPLSFSQPEAGHHIAAWQSGPDLYSSLRIMGWDRQPRILTATAKFDKAMEAVVGYAARAGISPAELIGIAAPLARRLGASALIPRVAAASPGLLRMARTDEPFIALVGGQY